jgi:hypothetical protein
MSRPGAGVLAAPLILAAAAVPWGCGSSEAVLIDPDAFGNDQGTLISIDDVRLVAAEMIRSMNGSDRLARIRAEEKPLRILVGNLKQRTSITIFDKELFMNKLIALLLEADKDQFYVFIARGEAGVSRRDQPDAGILGERQLQAEGAAGPSPELGALTGAAYVLNGEIRELLNRERLAEGGEREQRTIQYTLFLDRVSDGSRVWARAYEIVKSQVTGAVYQ